jgi:hypothetical protein
VDVEQGIEPSNIEEGRPGHVNDDSRTTGVGAEEPTQLQSQRRCGGPVKFAAKLDHHRVAVHPMHVDA